MERRGEGQRVCIRCLQEALAIDYHGRIASYLEHIDADVKCNQELYRIRLAACNACGNHISGICRICGCFVEMRAAVATRTCPDIKPKW